MHSKYLQLILLLSILRSELAFFSEANHWLILLYFRYFRLKYHNVQFQDISVLPLRFTDKRTSARTSAYIWN